MCSDSKDDIPRPQRRKRNPNSPGVLHEGGHAKYFCRNLNQLPIAADVLVTMGLHEDRDRVLVEDLTPQWHSRH